MSKSQSAKLRIMCDLCKKTFSKPSHLIVHERRHTGKKPFKCGLCRKAFPCMSDLTRHKKIHRGEKQHECDVCLKSFMLSHHLIAHKRTHSGEKPFRCLICSRKFALMHHLVRHKKMHGREKPFKCEFCDKSFALNSHLVVHRRLHTGEKPYKCDICGESFTRCDVLKAHKRHHSEEKSPEYVCGTGLHPSRHYALRSKKSARINTAYQGKLCIKLFRSSHRLAARNRTHSRRSSCKSSSYQETLLFLSDLCKLKRTHDAEESLPKKSFKEMQLIIKLDQSIKSSVPAAARFFATGRSETDSQEVSDDKETAFVSELKVVTEEKCEAVEINKKSTTSDAVFPLNQPTISLCDDLCQYSLENELEATTPCGITYLCFICNAEFDLISKLKRHLEEFHTMQC